MLSLMPHLLSLAPFSFAHLSSLTPSLPSLHTFPALSYTARFPSRLSHLRCSGFAPVPHQGGGVHAQQQALQQAAQTPLDPPLPGARRCPGMCGPFSVRHWQLFWGVGTSEGVAELRAGTGRQRRRQSRAVGSGDSPDVEQVGTCHSLGCRDVGRVPRLCLVVTRPRRAQMRGFGIALGRNMSRRAIHLAIAKSKHPKQARTHSYIKCRIIDEVPQAKPSMTCHALSHAQTQSVKEGCIWQRALKQTALQKSMPA